MRSHRLSAPAVSALVLVLLAGCGSNTATPTPSIAAPSPSPSLSPSPSPSAPPVDASQAFLTKINGPFTGRATISGQLSVSGGIYPVSGTADVRGADSHTTITIEVPGQATTQESQTLSGRSYVKSGSGPWFTAPVSGSSNNGISSTFKTLGAIKDLGVETRNGQQLHHLKPTAGTLPARLWG